MPAGPGLQVQRAGLTEAEHDLRVAGPGSHLAVGDGIQVLDPRLLRCVLRVFGALPCFRR